MYIGVGTVVLILAVVIVVMMMRGRDLSAMGRRPVWVTSQTSSASTKRQCKWL